jgi:hypothetical protein
MKEANIGWAKSSVHVNLVHVPTTIVEGHDNNLKWPDENK